MPDVVFHRAVGSVVLWIAESIYAQLVFKVPLVEMFIAHGFGEHVISGALASRQCRIPSAVEEEIFFLDALHLFGCGRKAWRGLCVEISFLAYHLAGESVRVGPSASLISARGGLHELEETLLQRHGRRNIGISKVRDAYNEEEIGVSQILGIVDHDGLHRNVRL